MKKIMIILTAFFLIMIIYYFSSVDVYGSSSVFTGRCGSPNDDTLFEETNTFAYNGDNLNGYRYYTYFDTGSQVSNNVSTDSPQITVLTHGLRGDASHWSNNANGDFAYDSSSILLRLQNELSINNGDGAYLYWAVMDTSTSFHLYNLDDPLNMDNSGKYLTTNSTNQITDITKHIIIVFQATEDASKGYNYEVYEEFNYMLSKIVYDVKDLNNGVLPKINLIGHSRGGLTNLEYVLDHPDMIGSVFSIGTPYFGSDTASTDFGAELAGNCHGLDDIICRYKYLSYFDRWYNGYNTLYSNINYHAIGGFSDSDFVFDALIEDDNIVHNYISDDSLLFWKWFIKYNTGLIAALSLEANIIDYLASLMRSMNYNETEVESIVEIISDIQYHSIDNNVGFFTNLWSNITHGIPLHGCPFFMNDLLVDLTSQIGFDEHSDTIRDYGFTKYQKCFRNEDYINKAKKLSMIDMPAIVHNLEARDDDLINYILSNISLGFVDLYVYDPLTSNTAKLVGYNGSMLSGSISLPDCLDGYYITEIGTNLFQTNGSNLTNISIPYTVTTISNEAFIDLANLETITFSNGNNLSYIGERAFSGCENLSKFGDFQGYLTISNNITHIGDYAFYGTDFSYINIGSGLNELGESAFSNISSLLGITVSSYNGEFFSYNDTLYNYDGYLMQYPIAKNQTSFTIPSQAYGTYIVGVLDSAFMNAENLSTINLGYIECIGDNAFEGCSDLTSISIPSAVSQIGSEAFKDCGSLNGIYFPSGLEEIGMAAFKGCSALDIVDIPSSVTKIGSDAFNDCSMLSYVTIARNQAPITSVGYGAFDNCHSTLQIEVPKNRIGDYKNKFGWNRYKTKVVPDSSTFPSYTIYDNSNITFSDSISAGLNKLYRLDVVDEYYYGIKATASYNTLIELYDSNLNFIDSSLGKLSEVLDSNTTYYVSISFESATNSGTISTQIKHFHDYDDHYVWQNLTEHKAYCYCMDYDLDPHVVSPDAFQGGLLRARCLLCNGFASFGEIYHDGIGGFPYTLNGSFILPNGVIVLEEADMEAYLNGTLVFINPNENIDRGNNHIPCIIRREDEYILD